MGDDGMYPSPKSHRCQPFLDLKGVIQGCMRSLQFRVFVPGDNSVGVSCEFGSGALWDKLARQCLPLTVLYIRFRVLWGLGL